MCSLRFENNLLTIKGVRFASISKETPLSKLSFAFVSLAAITNIKAFGAGIITQLPAIPIQVSLKVLSTVKARGRGHE